jgi:PAS domain S-box-containing protein
MARDDPVAGAATSTRPEADGPLVDWDGDERPRIALGIDRRRDRELLADLLSAYDPVTVTDDLPDGIDLCIVDPKGFERLRPAVRRWKERQRPAVAPVLLLSTEDENRLWRSYADAIGETLDALHSIPAPKRAILARVRGLLGTRRHSLTAKERHERLELYERAMDGASVGITVADAAEPDLPLVYVNDGFLEVTGYGREEAIGRNCRFLQGPETDDSTVDRIREALEAEERVSVEILNYRKSGEPFWNDLDIMPVEDDAGEVTHFLGFQSDITDRRRRTAELERYEQVLESIDDPVVVLDAHRRIELINAAAARLFDHAEPSVGTRVTRLFSADQRASLEEVLDAVELTGEPGERQFSLTDADGYRRFYQFRFQCESGTTGPPPRTVMVGRDITTIREYQNRLSVFDRVLRHNLRNKLNVIAGNAELLLDTDGSLSSGDAREVVGNIEGAVEDLLDLSDATRQFNRTIEPGDQSGIPVTFAELLPGMVDGFRERYPDAHIESDVSTRAVAESPRTIQVCLERLVENAVAYTESPTPHVLLSVVDRPDEGLVELRIVDDGPGFPERERNALNRGTETALEHLQGISLWFVSWAVENVGGELRIEDVEPTGAAVVVSLPRIGPGTGSDDDADQ